MWLLTDLFERYTNSVAATFVRLASVDAAANERALAEIRDRQARRNAVIEARRELYVRPALVDPHNGEALTSEAPPEAIHVPETGDVLAAVAADERARPVLADLPVGVRADVVERWVAQLTAARVSADALDKLRKDKKVRVAELEIIAARVLGTDIVRRKKSDHLEALSAHVDNPAARAVRRRSGKAAEAAVHAAL